MKRVLTVLAATAFLILAGEAAAMPAYEAPCFASGCGGVSDDGKRAVFTFDEPLADARSPEDQVYERYQGVTRPLVEFPPGQKQPVRLEAVSDDAKRIVVRTRSPLSADDIDGTGDDIFAIENGQAELLSSDPANPDNSLAPTAIDDPSAKTMQFERLSADGDTAYLSTHSISGGTSCTQFYARTTWELKKLPIRCDFSRMIGVSRDGSSIFSRSYDGPIESFDRLRGDDTTLLTDFGSAGLDNCSPYSAYGDVSENGDILLFSTNVPISPLDDDKAQDVYTRDGSGTYKLISENTAGQTVNCVSGFEVDTPVGLSRDGSGALFTTESPLSPADQDSATDLYRHEAGKPVELITTGPTDDQSNQRNPVYGDISAGMSVYWLRTDASDDLGVVAFDSAQRLVATDTDNSNDVYARVNGTTELISTGPASNNQNISAKLLSVSGDGSQIAFTTVEKLVDVDTDASMDVYGRSVTGIDRLDADPTAAQTSATVSKSRRTRTVLLSAESVAPKMKVGKARQKSAKRVNVRVSCSKTEQTGPCRGTVRIKSVAGLGTSGKGRFSIKAGRGKAVSVKLKSAVNGHRTWKASVRVTASDRLGNTGHVSRNLSVRG